MTFHSLTEPLLQHGGIALFFLLMFGIIGLPIPDETLLLTSGFLVAKGKLSIFSILTGAYAGSICGISVSYGIGRSAGSFLVRRYGHMVGLTEKRIEKTREWFYRMGMWALFLGLFVPGVRHLTGYFAGTIELRFRKFALFAYSGAILWATTFLAIGYFFQHRLSSFLAH